MNREFLHPDFKIDFNSMAYKFRFAIVSDLHIALPHTIWQHPSRFHWVEVSIHALESVLEHLTQLELDFLLIPGDLTQHGEAENHSWLSERLSKLPFPVYVVPGNHDVPVLRADSQSISFRDFPYYYRKFGYNQPEQSYYICELMPTVKLIGLNSNSFDYEGKLLGRLDQHQLEWLKGVLANTGDDLVLVMVHHNVIEHLPNQSQHPMVQNYILQNASELLQVLARHGVKLIFTGHLHVQDVAQSHGIYEITTGSLVSYPHPYRILEFHQDNYGREWLQFLSYRVESLPEFPNFQHSSREWMRDRSLPFLVRFLSLPPFNLSPLQAEELAPSFKDFWATVACGDALLDYPEFSTHLRQCFQRYGAISSSGIPTLIDNHSTLLLSNL